MNNIENNLQKKFKIRNNKVYSLYYITKNFLNKHQEVFEEYIKLKEEDFIQDTKKFYFENKIEIYKNFQSEINFIFKVCEKNIKLTEDARYNYIKESILEESKIIGKEYDIYKKEIKKYQKHNQLSKFIFVGLFLR